MSFLVRLSKRLIILSNAKTLNERDCFERYEFPMECSAESNVGEGARDGDGGLGKREFEIDRQSLCKILLDSYTVRP